MILWLLFMLPIIGLAFWASYRVKKDYREYSKVLSKSNMTGREVAQRILDEEGISDVSILETEGELTDHYDPVKKILVLSKSNYYGTSLSALGVSAHECGHALQHKEAYKYLSLRMSLFPVTAIASKALPYLIIGSLFMRIPFLMPALIAIYGILTLFQLITLPVEFDASNRAVACLKKFNIVDSDEMFGVCKVLKSAGWTYLAAFIGSFATLIYLIIGSRD